MKRLHSSDGYSLIEVMAAMSVLAVLSSFAVPVVDSAKSGIKLRDEANKIADLVGLAKMRASSQFSRARLYVDLAEQSYVLQVWNAGGGVWANEMAPVDLPLEVDFGWGDLDEPPPNTQDELGFAQACVDKDGVEVENTACIMFNSRGIPIDKDNSPIGGNAFYLTDGTGVRAITVTATPLVRRWWSSAGTPNWIRE